MDGSHPVHPVILSLFGQDDRSSPAKAWLGPHAIFQADDRTGSGHSPIAACVPAAHVLPVNWVTATIATNGEKRFVAQWLPVSTHFSHLREWRMA